MKLKVFDVLCLGGSLVIAIVYKTLTGDTEYADQLGLAFMMSWVTLQVIWFLAGKSQGASSN